MPYLMVNLNDRRDCRQAIMQLRNLLDQESPPQQGKGVFGGSRPEPKPCRERGGNQEERERRSGAMPQELPLRQKLIRMKERKLWSTLVQLAKVAQEPRSLPELDRLLTLPQNKMRSLKAIMAKLEHRFGIEFLVVDENAGKDTAGNPRYVMPQKIRRQILRLSAADES